MSQTQEQDILSAIQSNIAQTADSNNTVQDLNATLQNLQTDLKALELSMTQLLQLQTDNDSINQEGQLNSLVNGASKLIQVLDVVFPNPQTFAATEAAVNVVDVFNNSHNPGLLSTMQHA